MWITFKVNNKASISVILVSLLLTLYFTPCSSVYTINFEHVLLAGLKYNIILSPTPPSYGPKWSPKTRRHFSSSFYLSSVGHISHLVTQSKKLTALSKNKYEVNISSILVDKKNMSNVTSVKKSVIS